ncbi:MAG: formylglycine-generating enzyme family protein [Polyangiaceae bacterium]|nr:formylglycine-generating enzyme family protein [Polyangiaceae bacterium]
MRGGASQCRARVGRADLVRALDADPSEATFVSVAKLLGYSQEGEAAPTKPQKQEDKPGRKRPNASVPSANVGRSVEGSTEESPQETDDLTVPMTQVVPPPFWRMERITLLDNDPNVWNVPKRKTAEINIDSAPESTRVHQGAFRVPAGPPLRAWSRLWPELRDELCSHVAGREVDLPHLTRAWARGDTLGRIPLLRRRVWAPRVAVWLDVSARLVPFWEDQLDLCKRLSDVCGYTALSATVVKATGQGVHALNNGHTCEPTLPAGDVPLLVLGDLGMYASNVERHNWEDVGKQLRARGTKTRALVPVPPRCWNNSVGDLWSARPWERIRPVVQNAESDTNAPPDNRGKQGPLLAEHVQTGTELSPVEKLLRLMAPAALVEPGLLRALRRLLPAGEVDVGAEAEMTGHPDVRAADATGLVLHAEAAIRWRKAFAEAPETDLSTHLKERVSRVIEAFHSGLPPELIDGETLTWMAAISPHLSPPGDKEKALQRAEWLGDQLESAIGDPRQAAADLRSYASALMQSLPASRDATVSGLTRVRRALTLSCDPHWWGIRQVGPNLVFARLPDGKVPETNHLENPSPTGIQKRAVAAWPSQLKGPGSPIAWLYAAWPEVVWKRSDKTEGQQLILKDGLTLPIPREGEGEWIVQTDLSIVTLGARRRESWAVATGCDRYGAWADAEVKGVRVRFRWIPPGRFLMGSPDAEEGRYHNEGPRHWVTWTEGRWMMDAPVTQALWQAVMGNNPSRFESANRPVEQVSWNHCLEFAAKMSQERPELELRLPTEAEWEYACRAGTLTATWKGDLEILGGQNAPILGSIAWYSGNCGEDWDLTYGRDMPGRAWKGRQLAFAKGGTREVRLKEANPWGLYDMLGNVGEWCFDWFAEYDEPYKGADVNDPLPPQVGTGRVLRGGSWDDGARNARAATRGVSDPARAYNDVGFRLVRGARPASRSKPPAERSHVAGAANPPAEASQKSTLTEPARPKKT